MPLFTAINGTQPTSGAFTSVTTGTTLKTMMQIATPSTKSIKVVEWGFSVDGTAVNTPIKIELIDTGAIAATVTTYASTDIVKYTNPKDEATLMTLGTGASGFTASAEGTITAGRSLDSQLLPPTGQYIKQWPLGREPFIDVSKFLRIRVLAGTAVNALCYIVWEE